MSPLPHPPRPGGRRRSWPRSRSRVPRFLTHTPYQRLGVRLDWSDAERLRARAPTSSARPARACSRRATCCVAVDGQPLTREDVVIEPHQKPAAAGRAGPSSSLIERARRAAHASPCRRSSSARGSASAPYALPLVAVVAAPLVAFLLVWRRPDLGTAWVFLLVRGARRRSARSGTCSASRRSSSAGRCRRYLSVYDALIVLATRRASCTS